MRNGVFFGDAGGQALNARMILSVARGALFVGGFGPGQERHVAGFQIARQVGEELGILALGVHFPDAGEIGVTVGGTRRGRVEVHFAVGGAGEFRRGDAGPLGVGWTGGDEQGERCEREHCGSGHGFS